MKDGNVSLNGIVDNEGDENVAGIVSRQTIKAQVKIDFMPKRKSKADLLAELTDGRTELVFDYLAQGGKATNKAEDGVPLIRHCAYYGDVSAMKFLLANGETLSALGDNFDLIGAGFHGHWRLVKFLLESGADPNYPLPDTAEAPLHAALCKANSLAHKLVVKVLLSYGANPNAVTNPEVETGGFMRDCRTKGETPLHRAAAFGDEQMIQMLLDAGAVIDVKDMNGDSPLGWASWYLRPAPILHRLCYGPFRVRPDRAGMEANLLGSPR